MDVTIENELFKSTIYGGWFTSDKLEIKQKGWSYKLDIEMSQIDELIKTLYDVKLAYANR